MKVSKHYKIYIPAIYITLLLLKNLQALKSGKNSRSCIY